MNIKLKRCRMLYQAMTEYILVFALVIPLTMIGLGGIGSQKGFVQYLGEFYLNVVEAITMPIP